MKTRLIITAILACAAQLGLAQISFSGNSKPVFEDTPSKSTGLQKIYVLYDTNGVSMHYEASTDNKVTWYTYDEGGAAYANEIPGIERNGRETTLRDMTNYANKGIVIEEGIENTYVWVVNYKDYYLRLHSLVIEDATDCGTATLNVNGTGKDIGYYTITGAHQVLDRQMKLSCQTLVWSDAKDMWAQVDTVEIENTLKSTIVVPAPLCNTTFTLWGDRFLQLWDEDVEITSDTYMTSAVDVHTTAVQEERDNDNEMKNEGGQFGGSAPVTIIFSSDCTDAVIHKEWQMSYDSEFSNLVLRLNQDEVEQTFEEAGTFYWRFVGSNEDGTCEAIGETYTVNIGESELKCPNVFTPGTSEGANDIWKVSYKSIVEFHCWIFNTWGNQIIEFTDPSQGWDGTYRGKLVKPGVYYYVIKAKGSDGKEYKLGGDINIIRYKENPYSSGDSDGGTVPDGGTTE
ncbi:MAG: gliding motility-associated C-terminal domain-containing protein [Muribaculaceae bacterium]|nr:gliding motility-associated C-terminal domain-containing protein [Muribaculaceae bacterium]